MARAIVLAGLLGGLLGGAAAFAAMHFLNIPGASARTDQTDQTGQPTAAPSEARAVAEAFLNKLKEKQYKAFIADAKAGLIFPDKTGSEAFEKTFLASRADFHNVYGKQTGEYELIRETVLRPDLVRLVYLEKFERGAVAWLFVLYKTQHGWRLNSLVWNRDLLLAFPAGS